MIYVLCVEESNITRISIVIIVVIGCLIEGLNF